MKIAAIILATLLGAVTLPAAQAQQQDATSGKPLSLVVPFSPGGPTDAMARSIVNELKDILGQTVLVDNRAGAGGNIGADYVARAVPDGQTLLFGTSGPLAINASLYKKISYDPLRSFTPIINLGYLPNVLLVHPSIPAKNVQELVNYSKANPGKLTYASSGNGASSHLAGVMFNKLAGTDLQHIPYKGTGPALNDLVGGHVSAAFTDVLTALPFIKSGKLRVLGVTTTVPSRALPDVPTVASQGVSGFDVSVFFGIVAPAGTPPDVVAKLNRAFATALKRPELAKTLAQQGLEMPSSTDPDNLRTFMASEIVRWKDVVKSSGAQLD
ncbi:Bug family tripartite tricarboxylate transporter substrate binding protein [Noviherbaspirillum saxi]|uniref:Tripartite tricarboxylate transporter substrate binding protein n=1 Tax=Noviherbaspirillum saxi TaxID=2320863 RepID=A0A3A3FZK3_9BURK|nr:tripartite tricarboxylate transporter substrate binding protein [Noviherbaspirillum saxi]RJF92509.1 tripartite tricarboxylate transporter substrate binding protein [Noviherbaspirillum saxi]